MNKQMEWLKYLAPVLSSVITIFLTNNQKENRKLLAEKKRLEILAERSKK